MKSHSGVAATMFRALAKNNINIEMISTSEIKISCVIQEKDVDRAVQAIHEEFELQEGGKA
jgi:aspartate kinase